MAASFYSNSVHVDFDSVLAMDEPGMVSMFQALVASGLQGFLGCSAVVYEEALVASYFCQGSQIKMNWAKFLFSILKKMVSPGSKQAKGFAIQISLLLATFPTLELGESSEFPASKILSKKTVHRFVSINARDGAEEAAGEIVKRAVSKKRPAADVGAAVPKKKRTIKKKSVSSISTLELVAVAEEVIPIQQVLDETREVDAPADKAQSAVTEEKHWFDLSYEDLVAQWEAERPVVTASDTDEEIATVDVAPADGDQQLSELVDYIHRGGAEKKGESGSRGLQQPSNVQVSASAERTPSFAQRVEMAQRHIVHTVLDADANRALLERQDAAERDRERRRREARALKRRRRD
ncbi:hypothetical protein F511_24041 [Dorcoceras hygrometricum]|uniref:Uncharacterized protein n=1 Tax=Dorcoceras hygrometricum TaxID=472368 RepID=A0A2Z7A6Y1_9LAMI|nr:hypothetical protein F511_24041 [Dorcoceras hygrometricum]